MRLDKHYILAKTNTVCNFETLIVTKHLFEIFHEFCGLKRPSGELPAGSWSKHARQLPRGIIQGISVCEGGFGARNGVY